MRYASSVVPPLANRKKKVLFVITKANWGGAQRYVYDLATHLDQKRFVATVALGGDGQLATLLQHANIPTTTIANLERDVTLKKEWSAFRELLCLLRRERPDILHLNSSKAGALGALAGRITGVPRIIFTAHGWAFNEDRPWRQRLLIALAHWFTVLLCHYTIAVSSALPRQLSLPGTAKKFKILNPGRTIGATFSRTQARQKLTELRPALLGHENRFWFGVVAELHPIKRLHILIESFERLATKHGNIRLVIIGDGALRMTLDQLIKRKGLSESVFLLGAIADAARFLKAIDVFVLPSKSESYGYVLHEAGICGVPVIATNVGGIPDTVKNEVSGLLVPPDDVVALESAMERYLKDASLRRTHADALKSALKKRSLADMVRATEALYTL
jgi:glycosyltransferase involved in cell wall biosynthesis